MSVVNKKNQRTHTISAMNKKNQKAQKTQQINTSAVVKSKAFKTSSNLQNSQYMLYKKDWTKVCSMTGSNRREFLSSIFHSEKYSDKQIADLMVKQYSLQKIDFSAFELDPKVVYKIPKKICEKYTLIPIMEVEGTIIVAFSDPGDIQAKEDISTITHSDIQIVVAEYSDIKRMINQFHTDGGKQNINKLFSIIGSSETEEKEKRDKEKEKGKKSIQNSPIVQSVDYLIGEGLRLDCSDIHIEVYEKKCRVRFRVDGHLSEAINPPADMADAIASRIKVMSKLNISEKRLPQDGRLKININGKVTNFRVSTVPVVNGEKIVLRVLDTSQLDADITSLGMNTIQLELFQKYLRLKQGLILLTGPTGSGKTTTIYSGLHMLNKPDKNISTAEDPVEYKLYGINQVQINAKIGLTFASVLRSFLRQDPDVILVGEIRDLETANIAYRAAATGHLVLSTLHTNDASSTITRLMDIGLPIYSVAENTSIVVAQRLLRTLCVRCKVPEKINTNVLKNLELSEEEFKKSKNNIMKPVGCQYCNYTGYKGRIAVFEVLEITPELKEGIFKKLSPLDLKKLAIKENNLQTLRRSAVEHMLNGVISVDEVINGTLGDNQ